MSLTDLEPFVPYIQEQIDAGVSWKEIARALDGRIIVGQGDPQLTANILRNWWDNRCT